MPAYQPSLRMADHDGARDRCTNAVTSERTQLGLDLAGPAPNILRQEPVLRSAEWTVTVSAATDYVLPKEIAHKRTSDAGMDLDVLL
jgi:hypothetical protein